MKKIRYAVIGLGHIAQTAMLPAFLNAKKNSELVALISSDTAKLKLLSKKYKVPHSYHESEFDDCLKNAEFDALYISTPNTDHFSYAQKAVEKGIHVLCEKPLTTSSEQCRQLALMAEKHQIKFMVSYRLHFDPGNLRAIELAQSQKLGDLRIFNSVFGMQVRDTENIRLKRNKGGGPLSDIGIYCINASRYLFRAEPLQVSAISVTNFQDKRFTEVPEMLSVSMKFPQDRVAHFTCSFGSADISRYDVIGTKGMLTLDAAYDYAENMKMTICIGDKTKTENFPKHDQFAAELIYFSDCILKNRNPEPSVQEGLADLLVIEAIENSLKLNRPVTVEPVTAKINAKVARPSPGQKIVRPPVPKSRITHVHVTSPSGRNN